MRELWCIIFINFDNFRNNYWHFGFKSPEKEISCLHMYIESMKFTKRLKSSTYLLSYVEEAYD